MKETQRFKLGGLFKSEQLNRCPLRHHREKRFSETPRELEKKEKNPKKPNKHPRKRNRPRKRSLEQEGAKETSAAAAALLCPGFLCSSPAPSPAGSPPGRGPGSIWVMKTPLLPLFGGAVGTPRVHLPFLVSGAGKQAKGFSRTTRCASGCGRTCRGGGHPGGSTRSPSAPATAASRSSGGERGKAGCAEGSPRTPDAAPLLPSSLQDPPALRPQKREKRTLSWPNTPSLSHSLCIYSLPVACRKTTGQGTTRLLRAPWPVPNPSAVGARRGRTSQR